jgi:hypothetical protein
MLYADDDMNDSKHDMYMKAMASKSDPDFCHDRVQNIAKN